MDYEKKYKEALSIAKEILDSRCKEGEQGEFHRKDLQDIFPELKESDGEKIRKALLEMVHDTTGDELWVDYNIHKEEAIAWLEKQVPINEKAEKEKNDYVSGQFLYCKGSFNEFKEGESYWIEYIGNDTYIGRSDNILNQKFYITPRQLYTWLDPRHPEKQGEQKPQRIVSAEAKEAMYDKPAWSEEDEKEVAVLEAYIRSKDWSEKHVDRALGIIDELVKKLKSLKPHSQWKPSDEQMKILNEVLNFAANHESPHWNDYIFGTLNNLIRQIKKLMEK